MRRIKGNGIFQAWWTVVALTAGWTAHAVHADQPQAGQKQPNVLFLFADDFSHDSVHATGNDEISTPNIDSIAKSGTTFARAYNMGAWGGAVCVASRTMLNTGRFVWHAQRLKLPEEMAAGRTWAQQMKLAGYETYFTGKWHVGLKPQQLFDHVGQVRGGMPQQTPEGYNRPLADKPDPWSPYDRSRGGFWAGGKHWTEVVADDAVGFLQQASERDKPFFMYVAFNAPHDPRQSPQEFVERYPVEQVRLPENFQPLYPYYEQIGCGKSLRDERLAPFPRTAAAVKTHRQEYYAIITHLDREIGRILDALEQSGKSDKTVVFFTADHGLACGHHGLMGKQNMYEHSMRVPFFVKGPQVEAGRTVDAPIYLQDAMATTIDLAGRPLPEFVAFRSLLPILSHTRDQQYSAIYGGYLGLQRMVVKDGWKMIIYPEANHAVRLYDLNHDPQEMHDLAAADGQQQRLEMLTAALRELQVETGDQLKLESP